MRHMRDGDVCGLLACRCALVKLRLGELPASSAPPAGLAHPACMQAC